MPLPAPLLRLAGFDPAKPAPSDAAAFAAVEARLSLAGSVLQQLGEADPVRARGVLGARLARAADADRLEGELATTSASSAAARREKIWEGMIADGRVRLAQAFAREDGPLDANGKPTAKRVYAKWAAAQNTAYPELAAFEGWADSLPRGAHRAENAHPSTVLADAAELRLGAGMGLTERDKQEARRAGVDPDVLARQLATTQHRGGDAGERA